MDERSYDRESGIHVVPAGRFLQLRNDGDRHEVGRDDVDSERSLDMFGSLKSLHVDSSIGEEAIETVKLGLHSLVEGYYRVKMFKVDFPDIRGRLVFAPSLIEDIPSRRVAFLEISASENESRHPHACQMLRRIRSSLQ